MRQRGGRLKSLAHGLVLGLIQRTTGHARDAGRVEERCRIDHFACGEELVELLDLISALGCPHVFRRSKGGLAKTDLIAGQSSVLL
jgi:hypothetical protein